MDWMQCLTIIATVVGGCFLLHKDHKEDMKTAKEDMRLNIGAIREEMRLNDAKWERLFSLFVEKMR